MGEQLTVIAHIRAKPGMEMRVRDLLLELVGPTRIEQGCINYDLHQSLEHPGEFVFYENWTTEADLDRHAKSAHIQAFRKLAPEILDGPAVITKWALVPRKEMTSSAH